MLLTVRADKGVVGTEEEHMRKSSWRREGRTGGGFYRTHKNLTVWQAELREDTAAYKAVGPPT